MRDAFLQEIGTCKRLIDLLQTDRMFVEAFLSAHRRRDYSVDALLRRSSVANAPEVQYFLRNRRYLELGVSFHGAPQAVAWMDGEGIYCAPTRARLQEIEALGESEEAWTVRQFFLDQALRHLSQPGDAIPTGKVPVGEFRRLVLEASNRYPGPQRDRFLGWVGKALAHIETSQTSGSGGGGGASGGGEKNTRGQLVTFLRSFLQDPSPQWRLGTG